MSKKFAILTDKGFVEEINFYKNKDGELVHDISYIDDLYLAKKWSETSLKRVLKKVSGKLIEVR